MRLALAAIVALVVVAVPAAAHAAKVIPREAVPGATVELRGGDLPQNGKVKVAGKRAEIVSRKGSKVRFVVPLVTAGVRPVRMGNAAATMRVLKRFRGKVGVELAKSKRARKKIGPGGGLIKAKSDGITYTLNIPARALAREATITMTPVARLKNLPLTRNRPAAVQLRPNGLEFDIPVELTITGLKKPGNQVGFTMTDKGRGLQLVQAERKGKRVVVSLEHFTTPGAGGPTEQDYVNIFAQFLSSTSATLTRGQVKTLLVELGLVQERFPNFCANQSICGDVIERARESLERLIDEECTRQSTQPTIGGLSILAGLTADIQELPGNAGVPDCVVDILDALAEPAIANVATSPFGRTDTEYQLSAGDLQSADLNQDAELAWLEWVFYLGGRAQAVEAHDVASRLVTAFINAMRRILQDGEALCETNPEGGRALLDRGYTIALATGFMKVDYEVALGECICGGGSGSSSRATAAQTCPAGVRFVDRAGFVSTVADVFFSSDQKSTDADEAAVSDPLAPFSESVTSSTSLSGESASASASQNSSVQVGNGSLSFVVEGTMEASHAGDHAAATGETRAQVTFEVTSPVPYSVTGSMTDAGSGNTLMFLDGTDDDEPNRFEVSSTDGSTPVNFTGQLAPGDYLFSITGRAGSQNAGSGFDLTLTVG